MCTTRTRIPQESYLCTYSSLEPDLSAALHANISFARCVHIHFRRARVAMWIQQHPCWRITATCGHGHHMANQDRPCT
ncbi:hypothetical protein BST61_g4978 [Cercospora zeina]